VTWPSKISDEQAMWRVQTQDDHDAFASLVQHWEIPIRRLCVRMLGDEHRAEDLAQEAFARVFAKRRDYAPTARFSTWLWRIALNLCHDELRRRARRPELSLDGGAAEGGWADHLTDRDPRPDEALSAAETAAHVRRALQHLPETYRVVLVLRHYENLKFAEIAEVLGIPEGTVKSRMVEGLSRMARVLRRAQAPDSPASAVQSPSPSPRTPAEPGPPALPNLIPQLL
jgi:RNA polymerase sigma-70 factor (ECF subfamily)